MTNKPKLIQAIQKFNWWDYSMDDVGMTLEHPDTQEWVEDLADDILEALGLD